MTKIRKDFYNAHIKCLETLIQLDLTILETVHEDGTFDNERDQEICDKCHQAILDLQDLIYFAKFLPKDEE